MRGLPKSLIKKYGISKKAWDVYKGKYDKGGKSKRKTSRRSYPSKRRRRTSLPRRRRSRRNSGFGTPQVMKIVRLAALAAPAVSVAMDPRWTGEQKLKVGLAYYTGFDVDSGKFYAQNLAKGWLPFLAATLITYGIPKLTGMIRRL